MHRSCAVVMCLVVSLVCPPAADAESIARSFEALRQQERPGRMVRLFTVNGRQTIGRIAELSVSELVLDVKDFDGRLQRVTFAEADVREIRRKRSHWIGPVTGLIAGIVATVTLCRWDGECGNGSRTFRLKPERTAEARVADLGVSPMHVSGPLIIASLAGGPALGRLLDRPGLETVLYRAPDSDQP